MELISFLKDIFVIGIEKIDEYVRSKKNELKVNSSKNLFEIENNGNQAIYNYKILLDEMDIKQIDNFSRFFKNKDFSILEPNERITIQRIADGNQKDNFKLTIIYHKKRNGKKEYKENYRITL